MAKILKFKDPLHNPTAAQLPLTHFSRSLDTPRAFHKALSPTSMFTRDCQFLLEYNSDNCREEEENRNPIISKLSKMKANYLSHLCNCNFVTQV